MTVMGIDPGLDGGIAMIGPDGITTEPMPVMKLTRGKRRIDLAELHATLKNARDLHDCRRVFLEEPGMRPGQSVQSAMTVGRNFGVIEGMLAGLAMPYEIVRPQSWCKVIHEGLPRDMTAKDRSRIAVARLFPAVNLKTSARCKNIHEGMMDALLIGEFGRRRLHP